MTRAGRAARLRVLEEKARQSAEDRKRAAGLALRAGLSPEDLRARLAARGITEGTEEARQLRAHLEALPPAALLEAGEEAREDLPEAARQLLEAVRRGPA